MGSKQLDLYLVSSGTPEYTSQIQVTWPLATPALVNSVLEYKWMSAPKEEGRKGIKRGFRDSRAKEGKVEDKIRIIAIITRMMTLCLENSMFRNNHFLFFFFHLNKYS